MRDYLLQVIVISLIITVSIVFGNSQKAFAQVDVIIDLDGIATPGKGVGQEVSPGDDLVAWPTGFPPEEKKAGIDWLDIDKNPTDKTWTNGDVLFSEDDHTCPTATRNQQFDPPDPVDGTIDCVIIQVPLGPIPVLITDCDLETGVSFSGLFGIGNMCQDTRPNVQLAFFDTDGDTFWSNGEDIILDTNGNLKFDPPVSVGGKQIPIDTSTLVLAGTQFTTSWLIPALVAAIGIGLVIARKI